MTSALKGRFLMEMSMKQDIVERLGTNDLSSEMKKLRMTGLLDVKAYTAKLTVLIFQC